MIVAMQIFTEWGAPLAEFVDAAKHDAFTQYAVSVIDQMRPALLQFLDATNAKVIVSPEVFSFSMPCVPDKWFGDAEVANSLKLVPWAQPHEATH